MEKRRDFKHGRERGPARDSRWPGAKTRSVTFSRRTLGGNDDEIDSDVEAKSDVSDEEHTSLTSRLEDRTENLLLELGKAASVCRKTKESFASGRTRGDPSSSSASAVADESRLSLAKRYLAALGLDRGSKNDAPDSVMHDGRKKRKRGGDASSHSDSVTRRLMGPMPGESHISRATESPEVDRSPAPGEGRYSFAQGHKRPITCLGASPVDDQFVLTGGKDCAVLLWNTTTMQKQVFAGGRRQFACGGHFEEVSDVCFLEDSRDLFCSVGHDCLVRIWDRRHPQRCQMSLKGHKGPISSVRGEPASGSMTTATEWFSGAKLSDNNDYESSDDESKESKNKGPGGFHIPGGSHRLYTGSFDRTVKLWDLRMTKCLDTHYGHVGRVMGLDILQPDRPLTCAEDGTLRLWKIKNETHLAFATASRFIDACAFLTPRLFLSGSHDGLICAWASNQKKCLAVGHHRSSGETGRLSGGPASGSEGAVARSSGAVTSLASIPYGDMFFSGGEDGCIVAWSVAHTSGSNAGPPVSLRRVGQFNAAAAVSRRTDETAPAFSSPDGGGPGIVSAIGLSRSRRFLLATLSKESKRGRHFTCPKARNGLLVLPLDQVGCDGGGEPVPSPEKERFRTDGRRRPL